jgi:tetratricopeptide (TPR) repeat protein
VDEARARDFGEQVSTLESAVRRLVDEEGRDPSVLYGTEIENAVSRILLTCREPSAVDRPHLELMVRGMRAIARLHYARYHSDPNRPAALLWSAVRLFRLIRFAPRVQGNVPEDIAQVLDVLAAEDPLTTPGTDSPIVAIDTAARLAEYSGVQSDADALSRAETLTRWALEALPATDAHRVTGLHNLLGILTRRWEASGVDLSGEVIALADAVCDASYRTDPQWPRLLACAGAAYYVAATRTQSPTLLDKSIDLLTEALDALANDLPAKADHLQNLGRAHLIRAAWEDDARIPEEAVGHLRAAVSCSVPGDPHLAERHAWLAMALLWGSRPETAEAARLLDVACACREIPDHDRCPGLLAQVALLLWRVGPKNDAVLDRAVSLLTEAEAGPPTHTAFDYGDALVETLWVRWERTRKIADVDEVIDRLAARAVGSDTPPLLLNLVARSLRARWERTGDSVAIRHAIRYLDKAIERSRSDDTGIPMYRHNLGAMWLRLYLASGDREALNHAVRHISDALDGCRDGDAHLSMFANGGAAAYLQLWQENDDDADLRRSVELARRSVAATPEEHPDLGAHLTTFVAAALQAAVRFGDTTLLDEAVRAMETRSASVDPAHPAYGAVMLQFGQALLLQGEAREDSDLVVRGRDLIRQSVQHPHIRTMDSILACRRWADEAAVTQDWDSAAEALSSAVARLADLPGHRLGRTDHEWLLANLAGLATDAAAACLNSAGRDHDALERLEAGRGVLLAKALRDDHVLARLEHHDEKLADRVRGVQALLFVS